MQVIELQASRRSHQSLGLLALLFAVPLQLVGCSGGDSSSPAAPPTAAPSPAPAPAAVPPEISQARLLASTTLDKNPQFFPVVVQFINEPQVLQQQDQQLSQALSGYAVSGRYQATLQRLTQRAQISRVNAIVLSELACAAPYGGGLAGDNVLFLDGKLLDIFAEIANAIAMTETRRLTASMNEIVDRAVMQQLAFSLYCRNSDPIAYPDAMLTPAENERGVEIFTQLAGGIFYHEFGHVWGWHMLGQLREKVLVPSGGIFRFTSALEDNADITSGILSAKAGHAPNFSKLFYDLMAFTMIYRRYPGSVSYASVQTWEQQFQQIAPTYSPLAVRKALHDVGRTAWQQH